jgi:GH18 family chitinase
METDRRIFAFLVRGYRLEFQKEASHQPETEVGYDVKEIVLSLDYSNLITYDCHGSFIQIDIRDRFKSFSR